MKKIIYLLLLSLFGLQGMGQVWIDAGAVWHYDYWTIGYGGFIKMEYAKDTMIQGRLCQKITTHEYSFGKNQFGQTIQLGTYKWPDEFTSVSGDTVFFFRNNQFFVLYHFGASIGDHWIISVDNPGGISEKCDDTSRVLVTDTGHVIINGTSYRYITLEPFPNAAQGLWGTYVERFGMMNTTYMNFQNMFPYGFQCDSMAAMVEWYFTRFKCFQDSSFALYNPFTTDCEHILKTIGIEEAEEQRITVYPNPTSGLVHISNAVEGDKLIEVFNYQGALVQRYRLAGRETDINLSDLPKGLYWVVIKANQLQQQSFKIILF